MGWLDRVTHAGDREVLEVLAGLCAGSVAYAANRNGRVSKLNLDSQKLDALPSEFGELQSLHTLYLRGNQLSSLPPEMAALKRLHTLDLRDNQLSALPPEIGNLQSLHSLDLQNNELDSLPSEMVNLKRLQRLNLENNQLNVLPPALTSLMARGCAVYLTGNPLAAESHQFTRSINIPPEYSAAGISILHQFGQVLNDKYKDMKVEVKIERKGNIVTLIVIAQSGEELERIEQTFEEYGRMLTGQISPSQLMPVGPGLTELENALDIIELQVKMANRRIRDRERQIEKQDQQIERLEGHLQEKDRQIKRRDRQIEKLTDLVSALGLAPVELPAGLADKLNAIETALRQLAQAAEPGKDRDRLESAAADVGKIDPNQSPETLKEEPTVKNLEGIAEELGDDKSPLSQKVKGAGKMVGGAGKVAEWINQLVNWTV